MSSLRAVCILSLIFVSVCSESFAWENAVGKVAFLRAQQPNDWYGPPGNRIKSELIFGLRGYDDLIFFLAELNESSRRSQLEILRHAFRGDRTVSIDYTPPDSGDKAQVTRVSLRSVKFSLGPTLSPARLVAILFDPGAPGHKRASVDSIKELLVGSTGSVRDYYLKNSAETYAIELVDVLGWYKGALEFSEYDHEVPGKPKNLRREALERADEDFDFSQYDLDGDGILDRRSELAVMVIQAGSDLRGWMRDLEKDQRVDGVRVTRVVHVVLSPEATSWLGPNDVDSTGHPRAFRAGLGAAAHELGHLLLDLDDMYVEKKYIPVYPFNPGRYSLMDSDRPCAHLDAVTKWRLGWLKLQRAEKSGTYSVGDVTASRKALQLVDLDRGTHEYFVVENRQNKDLDSYERTLRDSGLAVWHVTEDPGREVPSAILEHNSSSDYPKIEDSWKDDKWANKSRRSIRLIRPIIEDPDALWSDDPQVPRDYPLRWTDGSLSGFVIKSVSASGPSMNIEIEFSLPNE